MKQRSRLFEDVPPLGPDKKKGRLGRRAFSFFLLQTLPHSHLSGERRSLPLPYDGSSAQWRDPKPPLHCCSQAVEEGGEWLAVAPLRSLPKPGEKRGRGLEGILEFSYATIIIARRENGKEKDKKGGQSALE